MKLAPRCSLRDFVAVLFDDVFVDGYRVAERRACGMMEVVLSGTAQLVKTNIDYLEVIFAERARYSSNSIQYQTVRVLFSKAVFLHLFPRSCWKSGR